MIIEDRLLLPISTLPLHLNMINQNNFYLYAPKALQSSVVQLKQGETYKHIYKYILWISDMIIIVALCRQTLCLSSFSLSALNVLADTLWLTQVANSPLLARRGSISVPLDPRELPALLITAFISWYVSLKVGSCCWINVVSWVKISSLGSCGVPQGSCPGHV